MKRMLRIIAVMLCAVMLMSSAAMAAGKDFSLKDIVIQIGDEMLLDLSGLSLNLGYAEKDGGMGVHLGLGAGDASAADIRACVQGNQLLIGADGIKSVYALDLSSVLSQVKTQIPANGLELSAEDQAALAGLAQQAMVVLAGSVSPIETDADGNVYQISVDAEKINGLLDKLAVLLDNHPEIFANSGYANFSEMLEEMPVDLSVNGFAYVGDGVFGAELYLMATDKVSGEQDGVAVNITFGTRQDAESGLSAVVLSVELGEGLDADSFEAEALVEMSALTMNDKFLSLEISFTDAEDEDEGLYINLSAPEMNETDAWSFILADLSQTTGVEAEINAEEGRVAFFVEEDYIRFQYAHEGNVGNYSLQISMDGEEIAATASGISSDSDGAWMIPAGTEAIHVLTMNRDQLNMLTLEAMNVVLNALAQMAQANPLMGSLLGSMMQ